MSDSDDAERMLRSSYGRKPVLDPSCLIGRSSPERNRQILEILISEIDKDIALLNRAPDHASWVRAAHGLKNSAAGVGAQDLCSKADEAEGIAKLEWPRRRLELEAALISSAQQVKEEARHQL